MIKVRNSNGYAAFLVLSVVAILFIGYYVMIEPHALIFNKFMNNTNAQTLSQEQCENRGYYYENGVCSILPGRARSVMNMQKNAWLIAPFVLILGLIIWYFSVIGRRDPRDLDIVRWR